MVPHSSTLAWKIPWTEEPGRLQSMESLRVGHDWATSLPLFTSCIGKEMATHSNILAWRIPGTEEPSGLPSMGLHRVGHDWSDLAAAASSKVTLIRSHNHQQAGNTGEGEEELDNNLLSKADFIIIFTFLEKPGKYMLAYENSQVFQLTWT